MKDLKVFLRPFEKNDLIELLRIEKLAFALKPRSSSWFKKRARLYRESFLVAEVEGKVVGYALGRVVKRKGKISRIAVDPQYRREGVGRQLVASLLRYFKRKGIKKAQVEIRVTNQALIKFFKGFRFKLVQVREKYYRDGTDACLMELSF